MANLEDMDGDFNFCKERRRDPFHGKSVRLRGARGFSCKWQMNDLPNKTLNPTIFSNIRFCACIPVPVTAVDMYSSLVNLRSSSTLVGGYQVLGKREAWDEVLETLQEHAVSVRCSDYNKNLRTHDLLYELPIIGHVISSSYTGEQPHMEPSSSITLELSSVPSRPIGERACYGGKQFRSYGCRFCWGWRRPCGCNPFRKEWGREVWELEREGCAKGHSVMISELDCGTDDGGCKDVDEKCCGKDRTVADRIEDDDEDDVRYEASDAEGDVASLVLSCWEYVGANAVQADSFSISSFGVSSSSSSSDSESSDMMSCDDTSSSGSDASMSSMSSSISKISSSIVSVSSSTSI
jgi:hypothetical protein